jgi:hypothetical protein
VSFFGELRRRNVVKVAVAYAIVGWLLIKVASVLLPTFQAPEWVMRVFSFFIIAGVSCRTDSLLGLRDHP